MLHTKFQGHWSIGSGEEDFLRFYPYIAFISKLAKVLTDNFSFNPATVLQFYSYRQIGKCVSPPSNQTLLRNSKQSIQNAPKSTSTPFLEFTKFSISSQFEKKNFFLKYSIYMNKTTSLLNQMTEDLCRSEHSSCMTVVPLDQNVKTYTTTQCKVLRIL